MFSQFLMKASEEKDIQNITFLKSTNYTWTKNTKLNNINGLFSEGLGERMKLHDCQQQKFDHIIELVFRQF